MRPRGETEIVSITLNAVAHDTRAFKVAASFARFGYESVVLEGAPSELDRDRLPFRLTTLPPEARVLGSPDGADEPGDPTTQVDAAPTVPAASPAAGASGQKSPSGVIGRLVWLGGKLLPKALRRRLAPLVPRGIGLYYEKVEPLHQLRSVLEVNRALLRSLPPARVYYLHSFLNFPAVWLKARREGARLMYDAHDANWVPDPELTKVVRPSTLRLHERLDRICAGRVNAFLTIGDGLAGLLEDHLRRRPIVIRNGHDFRLDEVAAGDVRSAAGVPYDAFLLVMTGSEKPGEAIEATLSALERLPERVHFALVGRDHDHRRELVAERGLGERVHLLPAVPPTHVASFIRTADASPILYEAYSDAYVHSLPNRFFHAVAAGLPILYPPLHEMKSLCERHDLGIEIDPGDADPIESAIRRLLDEPGLAQRLAANVKGTQSELSWEHEEGRLARVLERTLRSRRRVR